MPTLLIQCQGSPGPLSVTVIPSHAATVLAQYHNVPDHAVITITVANGEVYYINLALVSWMHAIDESESKP